MIINTTPLNGLLVIEPKCFQDERGFFLETYQAERYHDAGILDTFVQDNQSRSIKGVLRGMHFQVKRPQAQLVTVMRGRVFDVGVDLRPSSPTFGKWFGIELDDAGPRQIYMAPGFAHGFCGLDKENYIIYSCTKYRNKQSEIGIMWNDKDLKIKWPTKKPIVSNKDKENLSFKKIKSLIKRKK